MTTMTITRSPHAAGGHGFHPLGWLVQALATHHQRLHLEDLDDHMLADIGLDRISARRESHRPFWDMP